MNNLHPYVWIALVFMAFIAGIFAEKLRDYKYGIKVEVLHSGNIKSTKKDNYPKKGVR